MKNFWIMAFLCFSYSLKAGLSEFNAQQQPTAPDYSMEKYWSALPFRSDAADNIPAGEKWVNDSLKQVDVFFIYPTIYRSGKSWNADVNNKKLNRSIDNKPIKYQAGVFNASCRVYAPRYRQAILDAFSDTTGNGERALAFAYNDVKLAFEYYLKNYNKGRPFIIASHSQGTYHARRLLKEMIDNNPALRKQMVAAYAIGFALNKEGYTTLQPCEQPEQTGCYITWASFKTGYEPDPKSVLIGNVCINPITWTTDTQAVPASLSHGSMLLSFKKKYQTATGASIHNHHLWVNTQLPLVSSWDNLHIADYNLFWYDIRDNVALRVKTYLQH